LHRLAGASPAANLRPEPAAISDLFLPLALGIEAPNLSSWWWWWMLDVYRVVSEQFNDELTQLIFAINKASGFQKWRLRWSLMSEKKNSTCPARGVAARVEAGGYVDGVDGAGSAGGVGIGPA
jgi:hypothetical protein